MQMDTSWVPSFVCWTWPQVPWMVCVAADFLERTFPFLHGRIIRVKLLSSFFSISQCKLGNWIWAIADGPFFAPPEGATLVDLALGHSSWLNPLPAARF